MTTAWRLVSKARAATAFDGEGNYRYGNRWNHQATRVVYLSATTSLAALEVLAHAGSPRHLTPYVAFRVTFAERLVHDLADLPDDWRQSPAPTSTKDMGTSWAASTVSAVLRVPSVIVPWEFNYVVSVDHPDFSSLVVADPAPFQFDSRF